MLPKSIQKLIDEFGRLPGIGPKSAQRLVLHLLRTPEMRTRSLGEAVLGMRENVQFCQTCWHITDQDKCHICNDPIRDQSTICIVEDILDVIAIEKTGGYKGLYHVLHGVLSPINGIGVEDLKLPELLERIKKSIDESSTNPSEESQLKEIILATNPGLEGEATAMYILRELTPLPVKVTRIARGLPIGADLEYADQDTLTKALEGRQEY